MLPTYHANMLTHNYATMLTCYNANMPHIYGEIAKPGRLVFRFEPVLAPLGAKLEQMRTAHRQSEIYYGYK